jgi:hypothetical protein
VVQRHVLYLGEINDTQELAWRRSIEVIDEGAARPQMLSLFPEDRCEGLLGVRDGGGDGQSRRRRRDLHLRFLMYRYDASYAVEVQRAQAGTADGESAETHAAAGAMHNRAAANSATHIGIRFIFRS